MGSFAGRGGQRATRTRAAAEGALRPAPLAASSNETHLRPPCRALRPAALQRPTAETGAPAPPATLPPPAHASPTTQELTPSVQFLPFQARTATNQRLGWDVDFTGSFTITLLDTENITEMQALHRQAIMLMCYLPRTLFFHTFSRRQCSVPAACKGSASGPRNCTLLGSGQMPVSCNLHFRKKLKERR